MQRILFSIESLVGGGAEKLLIDLARCMQHGPVQPELLILSAQPHDYDTAGLVLHELDTSDLSTDLAAQLVQKWLLSQEQSGIEYQAVVSHLKYSDQVWSLVDHPNRYFCIHNHTSIREMLGKSWWKRARVYREARDLYSGKQLIAVSEGIASDMVRTIQAKPVSIEVIPNGFDLQKVVELGLESIDFKGPFVLHVGSFKAQKRHDRLIKAYKLTGTELPLVLIGKGSASRTRKIHKLINQLGLSDRVHLVGFKSNPYAWIKAADLLVLSSDCEGFGRVLVEALALSTPVVSTDCPSGPSDILTGDLASGLSALSATDLASKIQQMLKQPKFCSEGYAEQWSIDHVASRYAALKEVVQL